MGAEKIRGKDKHAEEDETEYVLTELGKKYGRYVDTGRRREDGSKIFEIRWHPSVIDLLKKKIN